MAASLQQVWMIFALCVLVIGVAGYKLTSYGDAIADKTGMGGTWVGLILIAIVTSLPELSTTVTAVSVLDAPDIAVGDVLGGCVYNLLILGIMDLFKSGKPVYAEARREHVLSAGFSIVLIGMVAIGILLGGLNGVKPLGHIGWVTPLIMVLYVAAMRTIFRFEKAHVEAFTEKEPDRFPDASLSNIALRYAMAATAVMAMGVILAYISERISVLMEWHESFTGTLFTAFTTSLPELMVTLAALRLGAINLAIGNIFGSNLFNMLILAFGDVFYVAGPLYAAVSHAHLVSAISALTMTGGVIVGLYFHPKVRVFHIAGWTSLLLFLVYLLNSIVLFYHGSVSV